ncbi:MAG: transglutaminase domain-containing protein [Kineosporiaceae bacterium]
MALPALGGAVTLSVLVGWVATGAARSGRLRGVPSALLDLAACLGFCAAVLRVAPWALPEACWRGPARLLSSTLPLVDDRAVLVLPAVLAWLSTAGAVRSVLAGRPPLGACLGWLALFVTGYGLTLRGAAGVDTRQELLLAAGVVIALLLPLAAASPRAGAPSGAAPTGAARRPRGRGLAAVAAGALLAPAVMLAVPGDGGAAKVPARMPAAIAVRTETPVAGVARLRTGPASRDVAFTVDVDAPWSGYVALADVDRYDGDGWDFTKDFRPSGGVVPADPDLPSTAAPTRQNYVIGRALDGSFWLPHVSRAQRVTGVDVDVDGGSGLPVPERPLREGQSYVVTSRSASLRLQDLGPQARLAVWRPPAETAVPAALRARSAATVLPAGGPCTEDPDAAVACLQDVRRRLLDDRRVVPGVAGTAWADVSAALLGPSRSGTPEQFATLFVVTARALGIPARVVTGFRVSGAEVRAPAAGRHRVGAAQAWTWAEVPVVGLGWVVADAAPGRTAAPVAAPTVGVRPSASPSPTQRAAVLATPSPVQRAVADPAAPPRARGAEGPARAVVVGAVIVVVLTGAAILVLLLRRRRRPPPTAAAVVGAEWTRALSDLRRHGLAVTPSWTGAEICAAAAERFDADVQAWLTDLAAVAEGAVFDPRRHVTDRDAERARRRRKAIRRRLRRLAPPAARLRAALPARLLSAATALPTRRPFGR